MYTDMHLSYLQYNQGVDKLYKKNLLYETYDYTYLLHYKKSFTYV